MSDITIVVDCNDADFARDICAALQQFPDVTALLPHHQAARDAQYASCWFPDPQLLSRSPGLKLIQAASAGVDHLPPALFASEIPLCRVIDEDFRHGMFEYALWSVLWFGAADVFLDCYVVIPRCCRYFTGLIAPNDSLIRFSLYQRMYLSRKQINFSSVIPAQSLP